ncbi:MAG TPA: anthranilate synthase component 1 [Polyangia bacterium]|jgi:anthranilate synthase component 1
MAGGLPAAGEVLPLARRLPGCPDPLALYARLCDGGRRPDTLLLESVDVATRRAEQSFLMPRAALRVECRGRTVTLTALTPNGESALAALAPALAARAAVARTAAGLTATYPAPAAGGSEEARLTAPSPFDALRAIALGWRLLSEPAATSLLAAGVFSYDLLECFEALPAQEADPLGFPELVFWLPEALVVINHQQQATTILAPVFGGPNAQASYHDAQALVEELGRAAQDPALCAAAAAPLEHRLVPPRAAARPRVDLSDEDYARLVVALKRRIVAGDVFQIVPSRTFSVPCDDPLAAYGRLCVLNPSQYMFYVRGPAHTLLGASPETAVRVAGTPRQVEICPIAGTARRARRPDGSIDLDLDGRLEAELRLSGKELAEHMMLIDLARNDVARVSEAGTRHVSRLLAVDRYSHVMHLVSHVTGTLRGGLDALHAYAASMNMGTLVGAPKLKAAELLRRAEATRRGPYGGAVGYVAADGRMDTAIIIRSAVVKDGVAHVRAGAGVVYDSDPQAEAQETRRKAQVVLEALGAAREDA